MQRDQDRGRVSLQVLPSSLTLVEQYQALPARHRRAIIRGDPLHLGPVRRLPVPTVAQYHPILIEGVPVALVSRVPGHRQIPNLANSLHLKINRLIIVHVADRHVIGALALVRDIVEEERGELVERE